MKYFVCSDLHGNQDMLVGLIQAVENAKEDYRICFLGDAADRGMRGYTIMNWLLENKQVIYLKGNHEDLFVKAARACYSIVTDENLNIENLIKTSGKILADMDEDISLYSYNGGMITLLDWIKDGMSMSFVNKIDKLPLKFSDGIYDFCHAGCTKEQWFADDENELLWNRNHFFAPWFPSRVLIHGHTPIVHLPKYLRKENEIKTWEPAFYYPTLDIDDAQVTKIGLKIDMDMASFYTNRLCVLEINSSDTLVDIVEPTIISLESEKSSPLDF